MPVHRRFPVSQLLSAKIGPALTPKRKEAKSPCAGGIAARSETRRGATATPALIPATKSDSAIPSNLLFAISSDSPHTGANLPVFPFSVFLSHPRGTIATNGDTRPHRRSVAPLRLLRSIAGLITALAFRAFYGLPVTALFASILGVF